MFNKLRKLYHTYQLERAYKKCKDEDDGYDFIFGLKSYDDISKENEASYNTMNDIDIIYDKQTKKYTIGIETVYGFTDSEKGEKEYIKTILDKFTEWMKQNNHPTEMSVTLCSIFDRGLNINSEFDSIEDLYNCFKVYATGFINT